MPKKKTRTKSTRAKRLPSITRGRASGIRKWTKQLLEMAEAGLVSGLRFTYSVVGAKKKKKKRKMRRKAKAAVSARKSTLRARKSAGRAGTAAVNSQPQNPEMPEGSTAIPT
jgi:hypothetical protein